MKLVAKKFLKLSVLNYLTIFLFGIIICLLDENKIFLRWVLNAPFFKTSPFYLPAKDLWAGINLFQHLLISSYFLATTVIGYFLIIKPFLKSKDSEFSIFSFISGFIPGHIIVITINRLITLFLPNSIAPACLLTTEAILALFLIGINIKNCIIQSKLSGSSYLQDLKNILNKQAVATLILFVLFLLVTIHSLSPSNSFVTGDATPFFLNIFNYSNYGFQSPNAHFPVFNQHYDEALYLYPLLYTIFHKTAANLIFYYWIFYSFLKTSLVFLLYQLFRSFKLNKYFAFTLVAFLSIGQQTLTQTYLLLFDSDNPLFQCLHPGRVIAAIIPIVSLMVMYKITKSEQKFSKLTLFSIFLLGTGISAFSINAALAVIATLGAYFFYTLISSPDKYLSVIKPHIKFLPYLLIFVPFIVYKNETSNLNGLILLFFTLYLTFIFLFPVFKSFNIKAFNVKRYLETNKTFFLTSLFLLFGMFFGLLFLGNLPITILSAYKHLNNVDMLTRFANPSHLAWGANTFKHFTFSHIESPGKFFQSFGLIMIITGIISTALSCENIQNNVLNSKKYLLLTYFIYFFTFIFFASILFYDYSNGDINYWLTIWVKSRLIEPWFYSIISIGLILIYYFLEKKKYIILFTIALFTLGVAYNLLSLHYGALVKILFNTFYLLGTN